MPRILGSARSPGAGARRRYFSVASLCLPANAASDCG
jgi:hypothetical protein